MQKEAILAALIGMLAAAHAQEVIDKSREYRPPPQKYYEPGEYNWSYSGADLNTIARPGRMKMLPPSEYDHPFEGRLLIIDGGDPGMMRLMCERTKAPPEMYFLGCASLSPAIRKLYGDAACVIIHASEELHARYQWTVNLTIRHEIAHCNGWPGNHPGAW